MLQFLGQFGKLVVELVVVRLFLGLVEFLLVIVEFLFEQRFFKLPIFGIIGTAAYFFFGKRVVQLSLVERLGIQFN